MVRDRGRIAVQTEASVPVNEQRKPTVLVGVSGSPASAAALRWAEDEAERRHGELRIVWIWQPERRASYARPPVRADNPAGPERARKELADAVQAVLGPSPLPDTTTVVVEGQVERELVAESAGADLLVLGSGARTSIGPVVRTCLSHAHCPVVVVSPPSETCR
jgi:nucleotide-binding universal stress UspA family protein